MASKNQKASENQAQHLPRRTRRSRPFRPVRRPLRGRDVDAADPRSRGRATPPPRTILKFQAELTELLPHYGGRPSPLYYAERLTSTSVEACGGQGRRQDLLRSARSSTTPAATRSITAWARSSSRAAWARRGIIAETGAGQHGVAVGHRVRARFGLPARSTWVPPTWKRQSPNVDAHAHARAPRSIR